MSRSGSKKEEQPVKSGKSKKQEQQQKPTTKSAAEKEDPAKNSEAQQQKQQRDVGKPNQTLLYLLFSTYGHIIDVVTLKTPKMRGQAHVAFSDLTSATLALKALHDFNFFGKSMEISYAKTKSDSIAKLDGTYRVPPPSTLNQPSLPLAPFDQSNQPQKRPRDDDNNDE
ncbi:hypothetical protein TRICI_002946 [Trichomonascus ciferrii]|uniref:RRM domain-containing protein n=1 Tax=Trichomonascus ciferrii TaxID=44093 RepID=A0A642V562_9ASCO|nr:hypothetical protein TRICI_002946 [Trichomonascus ciferrii]